MNNRYLNNLIPTFLLRHTNTLKYIAIAIVLMTLGYSFIISAAWLQLCYGLALFLFGMQSIEDGLHNATGGTLERLMAKSTATPFKSLLFGLGSTFVLQSSTLVSLLTIAFLSTGMISLAGGLAVIFGTNLGATSGIWLLALAGQSVSLSPAAIPMLVIGVLVGFFDKRFKTIGLALIGISLIFLGIDAIKDGFAAFGNVSLEGYQANGIGQVLLFSVIGFLLTCVLQSSHATLILTLAALGSGQVTLVQGFAIALGSNLGSSFTTALVGMLSSDKNGKRLALAHLIFNIVTALLALLFWLPITSAVYWIAKMAGMTSSLLQLALFHTLFNVLGILTFWKVQDKFAMFLKLVIPDASPTNALPQDSEAVLPRHLHSNMLVSADTAVYAVSQEVQHLATLSLEVVCHAIYIPNGQLYYPTESLPNPKKPLKRDVQSLYEWQIKPLYSEILNFTSKLDIEEHSKLQKTLTDAHIAAFHLVEIVKESKHLQKNMQRFLNDDNLPIYEDYMTLRQVLFDMLLNFDRVRTLEKDSTERMEAVIHFIDYVEEITRPYANIIDQLRHGKLDKLQASSLINDVNYVRRIGTALSEILLSLESTQTTTND